MPKETGILGAGGATFPDTPWSSILASARGGGPLAHDAVEHLARLYWRPVYFWFRYRWNRPSEGSNQAFRGGTTRPSQGVRGTGPKDIGFRARFQTSASSGSRSEAMSRSATTRLRQPRWASTKARRRLMRVECLSV